MFLKVFPIFCISALENTVAAFFFVNFSLLLLVPFVFHFCFFFPTLSLNAVSFILSDASREKKCYTAWTFHLVRFPDFFMRRPVFTTVGILSCISILLSLVWKKMFCTQVILCTNVQGCARFSVVSWRWRCLSVSNCRIMHQELQEGEQFYVCIWTSQEFKRLQVWVINFWGGGEHGVNWLLEWRGEHTLFHRMAV